MTLLARYQGRASFFLLCGETFPSAPRPLMGSMRNPTSPNGLKLLWGLKEHANKNYLVPHNAGTGQAGILMHLTKGPHSPSKWSTVFSSSWYRGQTVSVQICITVRCRFKSARPASRPVSILKSALDSCKAYKA